jgi:hypothetical protein
MPFDGMVGITSRYGNENSYYLCYVTNGGSGQIGCKDQANDIFPVIY